MGGRTLWGHSEKELMSGAETFGTPRRMAMIVKNAVVNENEFVVRLEYENAVKIFWSDGL